MRGAVDIRAAQPSAPFARTTWLRGAPPQAVATERDDEDACEPLLTARERAAVQHSPWFAALPLLLRHDILRRCTVRRYRCGQAVHPIAADGSTLLQLNAVAQGAVAVSMCRPDAEPFEYLPQGTWLVDPASFTGARPTQRLTAQGPTTIVTLGAPELAPTLVAHEGLEAAMRRLSHDRLVQQIEILDELAALDLQGRLTRCLHRLCERFGEQEPRGVRIALDIKQDALATLVRGSRARVNLHLKAMERAGVLAVERRILVMDEALFATLAPGVDGARACG